MVERGKVQRVDEQGRPVTAVAMMSGGLDSRLAARIVLEQGVKVVAFNYQTCFFPGVAAEEADSEVAQACRALGVPLHVVDDDEAFIEMLKSPRYGFGRHMNPCIDCRIRQFRLAKEYMESIGGHFLVTGEVLGQRPMSQRRGAMRLIDRKAEVEGLVLRPLSAKRLSPTVAEEKGLVDRTKLYGISGRSRKKQIELAAQFGITDYPAAAGGCLLTYEGSARKVRDLVEHKPEAAVRDFRLLRVGRHYRLPGGGMAIVGRDEGENARLLGLAAEGDVIYDREDTVGPIVLLCDATEAGDRALAAALCVSHSKLGGAASGTVRYYMKGNEADAQRVEVTPLERAVLDKLRV